PVEAIGVTAGETLYFSAREWCGKPDDAKRPNQLARAALLSAGDYQTRAPIFPEEARRSQTTVAAARVLDADGFLRGFLATHSIDGARAVVFFGEEAGYSSEHVTYFDALVKSQARDGKVVTINFDTAQSLLDSPAQAVKYTGGGGQGGDARLKDRFQPLLFGHFFNVEPVLEEFEILSYRTNVGDIDGYDAIKDKGVPLQWDGRAFSDYADYRLAALMDPPPPGQYMLGPQSRFALGDTPVGTVTCDGRGSTLFGAFSATTRSILRFILGSGKPLGLLFDEATFGLLPDDAIGLYVDGLEALTKEDIANALLAPFLAWVDTDPAGRVGIARAGDPDAGPPVDTLVEDDILEGWRVTPLDNPVRLSQEVTHGRNWRPMDPSEIADPAEQPLITADIFNALQREEEIEIAGDSGVIIPHPSAKAGPRIRGYFKEGQGAKDAASEIFAFFGKRLNRVALPVQTYRATNMQRGRRVAVVHAEITGGHAKNMTIFEINPSPSQGVTEIVGVMSEAPPEA
ncbi:MAG: hypothetical protein AB7P23_09700, partial [Amphiplicatus sp.]